MRSEDQPFKSHRSPPITLPSEPEQTQTQPTADRRPEPPVAATRTLLFIALLLFLNLQADGFPLGPAPSSLAFQLRLLPVTLLFLATLLAFLWPAPIARRLPPPVLRVAAAWQTLVAADALFVLLAAALLYAESRVYARFGYRARPAALAALTLLGIAALRTCLRAAATRLIATTLTLVTAFALFSLWSFPLALERSDMLPLLAAADRTLLAHHNPYRLYTFATEQVSLTYLPGTLLAFLPATALHLDLRLTNLACLIALAVLIIRSAHPDHRREATALTALFLLGPYLLYRHELYTPPHWLALAAALLLAHGKRTRAAAAVFGLSISMSQFSWILLPFFVLFLLESHGSESPGAASHGTKLQSRKTQARRTAIEALLLALATAALLTAPFALTDPQSFLRGTFGHWGQIGLTARPVNLSFLTAALIGPQHLPFAQLLVLTGLFAAAVRTHACRTFTGTLRLMTLALTAFTLLNLLVWGYFFLLLELLFLLYLLSANNLLRHPVTSSSASHGKT